MKSKKPNESNGYCDPVPLKDSINIRVSKELAAKIDRYLGLEMVAKGARISRPQLVDRAVREWLGQVSAIVDR